MDDRELEARLSQRLHDRFDVAPVPAGLAATVRTAMDAAEPSKVRFAFRSRALQLGWLTVAVVVALGGMLVLRNGFGPAAPAGTPTPAATAAASTVREFVVLPPTTTVSKEQASLVTEILTTRLRALGYGTFTSFAGYGIGFELPIDGPSDASTRRVLGATGDVEFVRLPEPDYGPSGLEATVGEPLPKRELALFAWQDINSVSLTTDAQSRTTLVIKLRPPAQQAVADYTTSHVSESLAIVVDGVVAAVPQINEPITGGEISIAGAGAPGSAEERQTMEWWAILVGGRLPSDWRGATVPEILTRDEAIAIAVQRFSNLSVVGSNPYVAMYHGQPTPIWSVGMKKTDSSGCEGLVADDLAGCLGQATEVRMLATTGEVLTLQDWDDAAEPTALP